MSKNGTVNMQNSSYDAKLTNWLCNIGLPKKSCIKRLIVRVNVKLKSKAKLKKIKKTWIDLSTNDIYFESIDTKI